MSQRDEVVFLFDVDNTLLDNDRVRDDLHKHLESEFGPESCHRYWAIFEELRAELGYADYLGALQRYRVEAIHDPRLVMMSSYLDDTVFRPGPSVASATRQSSAAGAERRAFGRSRSIT